MDFFFVSHGELGLCCGCAGGRGVHWATADVCARHAAGTACVCGGAWVHRARSRSMLCPWRGRWRPHWFPHTFPSVGCGAVCWRSRCNDGGFAMRAAISRRAQRCTRQVATVKKAEGTAGAQAGAAGAPVPSPASPASDGASGAAAAPAAAPAVLAPKHNGYYHFTSDGRKLKTKWCVRGCASCAALGIERLADGIGCLLPRPPSGTRLTWMPRCVIWTRARTRPRRGNPSPAQRCFERRRRRFWR
jgi:hypothetical protein